MKITHKHHRFTLIELLVVISVIALLGAILLPALSLARGKTQETYCANNIKQMMLNFSYYTDDSGFYPGYLNWLSGLISLTSTSPYYKGNMFLCPSDKTPQSFLSAPFWDFRVSIGYNYLALSKSALSHFGGAKITEVRKPSCLIVAGDSGTADWGIFQTSYYVINGRVSYNRPISTRHVGGSNIGFADGHVRHYKYDNIATYNTYEDPTYWALKGE